MIAAIREVVTAAGTHGMVGGQFLDVAGADRIETCATCTSSRPAR